MDSSYRNLVVKQRREKKRQARSRTDFFFLDRDEPEQDLAWFSLVWLSISN